MRRYNEEDERAPSLPHLCPSTNRPMNIQDDDIFKEDQYTSQWENKTRICHRVTAEVSRERRNFNPSQSWRKYNGFIRQCHDRLKWSRPAFSWHKRVRLSCIYIIIIIVAMTDRKRLLQYQGNDATEQGIITMLWGNSTAVSRVHLLTTLCIENISTN